MDHPLPHKTPKAFILVTVGIAVLLGLGLHVIVSKSRTQYREANLARARADQAAQENQSTKQTQGKPAFDVYYSLGQKLYVACAACHGAHLEGASAPPLKDPKWLTSERLIASSSYGVSGQINVAGRTYHMLMPAMTSAWSNFELAALTTYLQHRVTPSLTTVTSIRQAKEITQHLKGLKKSTFTAEELLQLPTPKSSPLAFDTLVDETTGEPLEN